MVFCGVFGVQNKKILMFKKSILKRIKYYEDFFYTAKDEETQKVIKQIIEELKNAYCLFDEEGIDFISTPEIINENFIFNGENEDIRNALRTFVYEFKKWDKVKTGKMKNYGASTENLIEYLRQFYTSFGGIIFQSFQPLFRKVHTNHLFLSKSPVSSIDGGMMPIVPLKEMYSFSTIDGSIQDILTLVHEFGHGVEIVTNFTSAVSKGRLIVSEVVSIFMEFLVLEDLNESLIDAEEYKLIHTIMVKDYHAIANGALLLSKVSDIGYNLIGKREKTMLDIISKQVKISPKKVEEILSLNIRSEYKYAFSFICAVELLMIYKNDPEEALDILERFMMWNCENSTDLLKHMESVRWNPGASLDEYKLILK